MHNILFALLMLSAFVCGKNETPSEKEKKDVQKEMKYGEKKESQNKRYRYNITRIKAQPGNTPYSVFGVMGMRQKQQGL